MLLVSKGRLHLGLDVLQWAEEVLGHPGVSLAPLTPEVALQSTRFPFEMHSNLADRIPVATARQSRATLVTADCLLLYLGAQGWLRTMDAEF